MVRHEEAVETGACYSFDGDFLRCALESTECSLQQESFKSSVEVIQSGQQVPCKPQGYILSRRIQFLTPVESPSFMESPVMAPVESPTFGVDAPSESTSEPTSKSPVKTHAPSKSPVKTHAPSKSPVESPSEPPSLSKPTWSEPPSALISESTSEPTSKSPVESTSEPTSKSPTFRPVESPVETPAEAPIGAPIERRPSNEGLAPVQAPIDYKMPIGSPVLSPLCEDSPAPTIAPVQLVKQTNKTSPGVVTGSLFGIIALMVASMFVARKIYSRRRAAVIEQQAHDARVLTNFFRDEPLDGYIDKAYHT